MSPTGARIIELYYSVYLCIYFLYKLRHVGVFPRSFFVSLLFRLPESDHPSMEEVVLLVGGSRDCYRL